MWRSRKRISAGAAPRVVCEGHTPDLATGLIRLDAIAPKGEELLSEFIESVGENHVLDHKLVCASKRDKDVIWITRSVDSSDQVYGRRTGRERFVRMGCGALPCEGCSVVVRVGEGAPPSDWGGVGAGGLLHCRLGHVGFGLEVPGTGHARGRCRSRGPVRLDHEGGVLWMWHVLKTGREGIARTSVGSHREVLEAINGLAIERVALLGVGLHRRGRVGQSNSEVV